MTLSKAIRGKGNQLGLRINQIHLLRTLLLTTTKTTEATKTTLTGFGRVLLRLDAVKNALSLSFVVNACVVAPAVGGKEQGGNKIQLAIASSTW